MSSPSLDPVRWTSAADYPAAAERLRRARKVAVVSHVRPDGDAIGSILALGRSLQLLGAEVGFFNPDGCPGSLAFLKGSERVLRQVEDDFQPDLVVSLDTAAADRMGEVGRLLFERAAVTMVIDHHISNPGYADHNLIVSDRAAVGQILFELLSSQDLPMDGIVRDALYVAIMTDTGGFRYANTSAAVLSAAAELVAGGVNAGRIADEVYGRTSLRQARLMARCVEGLRLDLDGRVASWGLSLETKRELGLIDDDSEGLSEFMRSLDGVDAAVFFEELANGTVRVSARSRKPSIDVCAVCRQFGGGGHTLAAGARIDGALDAAMESFLNFLKQNVQANH